MGDITGIDHSTWQVTLLPNPKRFSRGKALGFCGGLPVGQAETARAKVAACWWPAGDAELLTLDGYQDVRVLFARGEVVPGSWSKSNGARVGAASWALRDGRLVGTDLHDPAFERSWAEAAGGGLVVGVGVPKGKLGQRAADIGLVWRSDGQRHELRMPKDVSPRCTDGTRIGGSVGSRAALWTGVDAEPVDLAPARMPGSEVCALDGDTQVGIAFAGLRARAVLWRGSADSFTDLTPEGFEVSRAFDAARGYQVGLVRVKDSTRNGASAYDDRAVIWQGSAERWFDLNALLPAPYNASNAWAIHFDAERVHICGEANQVEVSDPGTPRESHYTPAARAVLWTARLSD
jgi:hypothetical protein